jgi:hypothetical protein
MAEPSGTAGGRETEDLRLEHEEAELLGVERRRRDRTVRRHYPHAQSEPAISEEELVGDLAGDDRDERREDVSEAFADALDRVGTEDDPDSPRD